ncbi:MAG: type II toxin-antitoxin system Phd/YefM family antitoxin [Chloroflexi bacterium]|nr:type II toxin-antitoxin system Phd/YefM family antitoxin [Chloroflexota bacterium]
MRSTRTVGVRELRQHATEIVRQVRVKGVAVQITYRGKVIARLIPVSENLAPPKESSAVWSDLDQLAAEIGARWPANATALDAVRDGRREL